MRCWLMLALCGWGLQVYGASVTDINLAADAQTMRLSLDCQVEYLNHEVVDGKQLQIRLRADDCATVSQDLRGPALAQFSSVRDKLERVRSQRTGEHIELSLWFHDPQRMLVTQGRSRRHLSVLAIADPRAGAKVAAAVAASTDPQSSLDQAKEALIAQRYEQAITLYRQVIAQDDVGYHPVAIEYLGVAYEKSGQNAKALEQFQQFTQQFPDDSGAARVRQRLDALQASRTPERTERVARVGGRWKIIGEVSQDYWRVSRELDDLAPDVSDGSILDQSALVTLANVIAEREGARFHTRTQISLGHNQEFDRPDSRERDGLLVSHLYTEVFDQALGWRARVGRQTAFGDGVLGRFDGLRASYQWRRGPQVNVTAGLPVDTPQFAADQQRAFVGASLHWRQLVEGLDLRVFTHAQNDDGIAARRAVGGDVAWRKNGWQFIGALDYDASFDVLNNAYLQVRVTPLERITLHADINYFALPFLTTRNALIGQPTTRLDVLLEQFSEGQVRRLARHRTSDAQRYSAGLVASLSERWTLNADTTFTDVEASAASGGVAGRPSRRQFYTSVDFIGASLFTAGDSTNLGLRLDSTDVADTVSLIMDLRLPIGPRLRLNPRVMASFRDAANGDRDQFVIPSLRLTYLWGGRYELELEAVRRWQQREFDEALVGADLFPFDEEQETEDLVALRWRVLF